MPLFLSNICHYVISGGICLFFGVLLGGICHQLWHMPLVLVLPGCRLHGICHYMWHMPPTFRPNVTPILKKWHMFNLHRSGGGSKCGICHVCVAYATTILDVHEYRVAYATYTAGGLDPYMGGGQKKWHMPPTHGCVAHGSSICHLAWWYEVAYATYTAVGRVNSGICHYGYGCLAKGVRVVVAYAT